MQSRRQSAARLIYRMCMAMFLLEDLRKLKPLYVGIISHLGLGVLLAEFRLIFG